jgi:tight adherence protein C
VAPLLAGLAAVLALLAGREALVAMPRRPAAGGRPDRRLGDGAISRALGERARGLAETALRLGIPDRLARAGLAERVPVGLVLGAKAAAAGWGLLAALVVAPVIPGGLAPLVFVGMPAAGFVGPDALLERAGRRRRARAMAAFPDALDLLAVGVGTGRSPDRVLADIAAASGGPLAAELGVVVAEIECGASQREAIEALRERLGGRELGGLAAALDRSRRFGSPLADQLHELAASVRREARRRIEERAARAAPKIQLVVALVLVPSVLLLLVAALVAHSGALLDTS